MRFEAWHLGTMRVSAVANMQSLATEAELFEGHVVCVLFGLHSDSVVGKAHGLGLAQPV